MTAVGHQMLAQPRKSFWRSLTHEFLLGYLKIDTKAECIPTLPTLSLNAAPTEIFVLEILSVLEQKLSRSRNITS